MTTLLVLNLNGSLCWVCFAQSGKHRCKPVEKNKHFFGQKYYSDTWSILKCMLDTKWSGNWSKLFWIIFTRNMKHIKNFKSEKLIKKVKLTKTLKVELWKSIRLMADLLIYIKAMFWKTHLKIWKKVETPWYSSTYS